MDEFTARLEAEEAERKEHPERFEIIRVCRECGDRKSLRMPKGDVQRYVEKHGSNEILGYCERHDDDSSGDDDA